MNRYLEKRMKQRHMHEQDGHNYRGMYGGRMSEQEMNQPLGYDRGRPFEIRGEMRRPEMRRGGRGRDYADYNDYGDYNDYRGRDRDMMDSRRGVRGSGRGRDYRDYNDYNDYEDYGYNRGNDRRGDYNDYGNHDDYGEDYAAKGGEEEYKEDLKKWIEKMKSKDRFKVPYDKIIEQAKNMGVKFEKYSELEFYAVYLAMVTDYKTISGEYSMYLKMAKDFLEDDDAQLKESEKVCAYLYTIVLGE